MVTTLRRVDFNNSTMRSKSINKVQYWPMRDLGVLLGYDSNGGNLSRQLRNGFCSKLMPGIHYIEVKTKTRAKLIWLTSMGLQRTVELVIANDKKRKHMAADFWVHWLELNKPKEKTDVERITELENRLNHAWFVIRELEDKLNNVTITFRSGPALGPIDLGGSHVKH